jgi:hypothetical protein
MQRKIYHQSIGNAFENEKTKEKSPDFTGKITLQGDLLRTVQLQLAQSDQDKVEVNVALWFRRTNLAKKFVTVVISPLYTKTKGSQRKSVPARIEEFFSDDLEQVDCQDEDESPALAE